MWVLDFALQQPVRAIIIGQSLARPQTSIQLGIESRGFELQDILSRGLRRLAASN